MASVSGHTQRDTPGRELGGEQKATRRQTQRLERGSHKPRNAWNHWLLSDEMGVSGQPGCPEVNSYKCFKTFFSEAHPEPLAGSVLCACISKHMEISIHMAVSFLPTLWLFMPLWPSCQALGSTGAKSTGAGPVSALLSFLSGSTRLGTAWQSCIGGGDQCEPPCKAVGLGRLDGAGQRVLAGLERFLWEATLWGRGSLDWGREVSKGARTGCAEDTE